MLTKELLDKLPDEMIFAMGLTIDGPGYCNVANTGKLIKWVAYRNSIGNWAVYVDNPYSPQLSYEGVARVGDKVHNAVHIRELVPCDDEAFKFYRH